MEVSGQLHAPAAVPPGEEVKKENTSYKAYRRENCLAETDIP
jgi:hypothetical protein